jgi:hypothetical protein
MSDDIFSDDAKQRSLALATDLLLLAAETGTNIKTVFRDRDDGETPVGLVLAITGTPEHLESLLDVIDMVNANHNVQNAARYHFGPDHTEEQ